MRVLLARVALFVLFGTAALPAWSAETVGLFPQRPLDPLEDFEQLVDHSELLLIARVTAVGEKRITLEPIEWLRGGLDGETIDVLADTSSIDSKRQLPAARLAGVDTLGILVRLERSGTDWRIARRGSDGMGASFRVLAQRQFRAVRDSARHARARMGLDSLIARADLIVVASEPLTVRATANLDLGALHVVDSLKGKGAAPAVGILPYNGFRSVRGDVLFLRNVGERLYEPIPFARAAPPDFSIDLPGGLTPAEVEAAVRAALAPQESRGKAR